MRKARIINALFCLYLWLSDILSPVIEEPGIDQFWALKAEQMISFNDELQWYWSGLSPQPDHPIFYLIGLMLGRGIIPLVLWFGIDFALRRAARRAAGPLPPAGPRIPPC